MTISINSDIGESFGIHSFGNDERLLPLIDTANVACGFHAGDPSTMASVCRRAVEKGVAIGAQVGYRDLAGFGRRRIDYAHDELRDDIVYQIGALEAFCRIAGDRVRYVKPHGALYNTAAVDELQASAVVAAVVAYDPALPVLCQPGSVLSVRAVEAGLTAVGEGFADRGYLPDGRLVPRSRPDALVHDPDEVVARVVQMAVDGSVTAVDGSTVECRVRSICLHGDTPGAVLLARAVRAGLAGHLTVQPF
jgi:UPF0271 protein